MLLVLLVAVGGCHPGQPIRPTPPGEQYTITNAELVRTRQANIYDAIRIARPFWFSRDGRLAGRSGANIVVYLQDQPLGSVAQLQRLPIRAATRVRYLDATEALLRFGHQNGARPAIVVEESPERRQ